VNDDARRTAAFGGVAAVLLFVTWATAPRVVVPDVLAERGQLLFPQFRDPNAAASLEVIEFDPSSGTVRPFKVQNRNGRWTIPSQHDYPADARDQLAATAAAVIALKRDDFASDNVADHEAAAVLDPLDTTLPALQGRGTRVIIRGSEDDVIADVILGKEVEGHPGFRYVRQPGQRRVYTSNIGNLKISTAFGDWIERNLLQAGAEEIDAINLRNYSFDRSTGRINPGETMLLQKTADGDWTINGLQAHERLDLGAVEALLSNLASLTITGVLPKPAGISATLSNETVSASVTAEDRADLARKGFYLAPDGQLISNRGEMIVRTVRGVFYTLRFGDIAPGTDASAAAATSAAEPAATATPRENRYLFIMADFDAQSARTPGRASEGAEKVGVLRARFAPWYYVIAANSFSAIHPRRSDLVKPRATTTTAKAQ
jgi:hypothetical protein